jgi:hypothetical protein
MSREPEVRIEDGPHHDHRVAGQREMVGDEKRAETDDCGDDDAD